MAKRPIAAGEAVFDEWKKYAVFFLGAPKEITDMTLIAKLGASKVNSGGVRTHVNSFNAYYQL